MIKDKTTLRDLILAVSIIVLAQVLHRPPHSQSETSGYCGSVRRRRSRGGTGLKQNGEYVISGYPNGTNTLIMKMVKPTFPMPPARTGYAFTKVRSISPAR